MKLKALSEILNEKFALLNTLDKEVLVACPTDDIEGEIEEAEDVRCRIIIRTEINSNAAPMMCGKSKNCFR